ncbi:hypothetical protein BH10PLA1_BH10PLA1_14830 [soil metagenome]
MIRRLLHSLAIALLLYVCWLAMTAIHEAGHVLGAKASGGVVNRVVWGPVSLSRTDVYPNPNPRLVTWAGPAFGALAPLLLEWLGRRSRFANLLGVLAGFCLIANGAYLASGVIYPVGDARDLIHLGTRRWVLLAAGMPMCVVGLLIWHKVSPRFRLRH